MIMTRNELLNFASLISKLNEMELNNVKTSYGIAKNIKLIADEVNATEKIRNKITEEFENKRIEICEKFAEKDEEGNAKIVNNNYIGIPNEMFNKEMDTFKAEYQPKIDELIEFLKEDVELDLYKMKLECFPNTLKPIDIAVLMPIIEE